ncbi:hypothetical protein ACE1OE_09730 [Vibrio sp. E150_011]
MNTNRFILASFTLSLLSACGGGSSEDTNTLDTKPNIDAIALYDGNKLPASNLNISELSTVLPHALYFQNSDWTSTINTTSSQQAIAPLNKTEGIINCFIGTKSITTKINPEAQTGYQIQNYHQCDINGDGNTIDGTLLVEVTETDLLVMQPVSMKISYSNFKMANSDGNYKQIDGSIKDTALTSCHHTRENNISINTNVPSESLWVNVTTSAQCTGESENFYAKHLNQSGRIYIANKGYYDINSEDLVYFQQDFSLPKKLGTPLVLASGQFTIRALNQEMVLTAQYHPTEQGADMPSQFEMSSHLLLQDASTNDVSLNVRMPSWMLSMPELINFSDSDGDRMWDGYENVFGLDPLNDDANQHLDNDQFTNLSEFLAFTDPADPDNTPNANLALLWTKSVNNQLKLEGLISPYYAANINPFSLSVDLQTPANLWRWVPTVDNDCAIVTITNGHGKIICNTLQISPFSSFLDPSRTSTLPQSILGQLIWLGDDSGYNLPPDMELDIQSNQRIAHPYILVQ